MEILNLQKRKSEAQALSAEAVQKIQTGKLQEGISLLAQALTLDNNSAPLHRTMGAAMMRANDQSRARHHYLQAYHLEPNNVVALNNLGVLSLNAAQSNEAATYFQKTLALQPDNFDALSSLGVLYGQTLQYDRAEEYLKKALQAKPASLNTRLNLGRIYLERLNVGAAKPLFEKILQEHPNQPDALTGMGEVHRIAQRYDDAIDCFRRSISFQPNNPKPWTQWAMILEFLGKLEDAQSVLNEASKFHKSNSGLSLIGAKVLRRQGNIDAALALLEPEMQKQDANNPAHAVIFFEMGQIYERKKDTEKAFSCFEKAHQTQLHSEDAKRIDKDIFLHQIRQCQATYSEKWVQGWTQTPPYTKSPEPVFLIGFPRSGTTLLDQILSSHPDAAVAEELPAIGELVFSLSGGRAETYPNILSTLSSDQIEALRMHFFDIHDKHGVSLDKRIMVDKFPLNLVHVGLIVRLFPQAKFILALRHPCDCILSCFMQPFTLNEAMIHFTKLESAAALYDSVFRLWDQYKDALHPNVHVVKYEDVVDNFKPTIETLLSFLGLDWDDRVLEYDKTARERGAINTPSYSQVTQKIYKRASGRWNGYKDQMNPVLNILLPWAQAHGYED